MNEQYPNVFIHPTAIIDDNVEIGEGTRIWAWTHLMKGVKVGKNCIIGERVHIGADVILGDNCKVQNGVNLYTGVVAEDFVFFGPNCQTTNELNIGLLNRETGEQHMTWELGKTIFKKGCSIGAQAVIVCGSKDSPTIIGEFAIVGSGSVVVKSVPAGKTVVGNPAHHHLKRKL